MYVTIATLQSVCYEKLSLSRRVLYRRFHWILLACYTHAAILQNPVQNLVLWSRSATLWHSIIMSLTAKLRSYTSKYVSTALFTGLYTSHDLVWWSVSAYSSCHYGAFTHRCSLSFTFKRPPLSIYSDVIESSLFTILESSYSSLFCIMKF